MKAGDKSFKVWIDGYDQVPHLTGQTQTSARPEFVYFDDDGELVAFRDRRFKYTFAKQEATGMAIWRNPMTKLRAPILIDLNADPYEYAPDGSANYETWVMERAFLVLPASQKVAAYLASYKAFPPRQRPASFSIDQVVEKLESSLKPSR